MPPGAAIELSACLLVALTSSLHCVGMCGGLAMAAGPRAEPRPGLFPGARALAASQAIYHAGKLSSYLFLGALAVLLGGAASRLGVWPGQVLSLLAGALLVSSGLKALGFLPDPDRFVSPPAGRPSLGTRAARAWAGAGAGLLALGWPLRPLLLGAFSGLLPCPIVYAFLARSAASASPLEGIATMAALGLGTVPALATIAALGQGAAVHRRVAVARTWGAVMVVLGGWTLARGLSLVPCCG